MTRIELLERIRKDRIELLAGTEDKEDRARIKQECWMLSRMIAKEKVRKWVR